MKTESPPSIEEEAYHAFRLQLERYALYFYQRGIKDALKHSTAIKAIKDTNKKINTLIKKIKKRKLIKAVKKTKKNSEAW